MTDETEAHGDNMSQAAHGQLKSIVERVERLAAEKDEIAEQIKEIFAEAKGSGFEVPVIRKIIARRKKDRAKVQEEEAIMDLYLVALGEV